MTIATMKAKKPSALEEMFALHVRAAKLPEPIREHVFAPPRKFRFDFAWADRLIACEIDGGTWSGKSRHTTGEGFAKDCEKTNLAALAGWRVFRFTGDMVRSGAAIATVIEALKEAA